MNIFSSVFFMYQKNNNKTREKVHNSIFLRPFHIAFDVYPRSFFSVNVPFGFPRQNMNPFADFKSRQASSLERIVKEGRKCSRFQNIVYTMIHMYSFEWAAAKSFLIIANTRCVYVAFCECSLFISNFLFEKMRWVIMKYSLGKWRTKFIITGRFK